MVTQGSLFKICSMMGNYRTFLMGRATCVGYQQQAGMKRSVEEKLGLTQKPKRPLTPYFRFLNKIRPSLMKNNPDVKITEIAKLAGQEWAKLSASSKQELESAYHKDYEVYAKVLEKYNAKLSDEDRVKIKDARQEIVDQKEKLKIKMRMQELGRPKRPASAFFVFFSEKGSNRGNLTFFEWRAKILEQWKNLKDSEKEVYLKRSRIALEAHKREMRLWEERMIRMGNIDVVRNEALIEARSTKKKLPPSDKE